MDKVERFKRAYEYLRNRGMVHTQKDLAEIMQATPPHVSLAFKGDVKYLTDSFLLRFNEAFGRIFNYQWLILGEGDMLKEEEEEEEETAFKQSETSRFLSMLEKKDEQIDRLIALLEQKFATEEKKEKRVG